MMRKDGRDDDWEDGEGDAEDSEYTMPCPHCRREIHEDSERCPYCENYISAEDSPPRIKSLWIIVGTVLSLAAIIALVMGSL